MQKHIDSYRKNLLSKVLLLASFCTIFSNFVAASSANLNVVRALDLAYSVKNSIGQAPGVVKVDNTYILQDKSFMELWISPVWDGTNNFSEIPLIAGGDIQGTKGGSRYTLATNIQNAVSQGKSVTLSIVVTITNSVPTIQVSATSASGSLGTWTYTSKKIATLLAGLNMVFKTNANNSSVQSVKISKLSSNSWGCGIQLQASPSPTAAQQQQQASLQGIAQQLATPSVSVDIVDHNNKAVSLSGTNYYLYYQLQNATSGFVVPFTQGSPVVIGLSSISTNLKATFPLSSIIPVASTDQFVHAAFGDDTLIAQSGGENSLGANGYWWYGMANMNTFISKLSSNNCLVLNYNTTKNTIDVALVNLPSAQGQQQPTADQQQQTASLQAIAQQLATPSVSGNTVDHNNKKVSLSGTNYYLYYQLKNAAQGYTLPFKQGSPVIIGLSTISSTLQQTFPLSSIIPVATTDNFVQANFGDDTLVTQVGGQTSLSANAYWWFSMGNLNTFISKLSSNNCLVLNYNTTKNTIDVTLVTLPSTSPSPTAAQQAQQAASLQAIAQQLATPNKAASDILVDPNSQPVSLSGANYYLYYQLQNAAQGYTLSFNEGSPVIIALSTISSTLQQTFPLSTIISVASTDQFSHLNFGDDATGGESSLSVTKSYWFHGWQQLNTAISTLTNTNYLVLNYNTTKNTIDVTLVSLLQIPPVPSLSGITPISAIGFAVSPSTTNSMLVGSDLWIGLIIPGANNTSMNYLLANNATPINPDKSPWSTNVLPNMSKVLNSSLYSVWQNGVYFRLVVFNKQVWVCAQDYSGSALAWDVIPGLTTLPTQNVSWIGSSMASGVSATVNNVILYREYSSQGNTGYNNNPF